MLRVVAPLVRRKSYVGVRSISSSTALSQQAFSRAKTGSFAQEPPTLGNQYLEDVTVQKYLRRHVPQQVYEGSMHADLSRFGARCGGEVAEWGRLCELEPPTLRLYDAWGRRVDEIVTSQAWQRMKGVSAEEGLIASAYDGSCGEYSRLFQMVKLYLFAPSSGLYNCPLAMTDGAAKTFSDILAAPDAWLPASDPRPLGEIQRAWAGLTSRDPALFWTSGQWMTEKAGGSDVGKGTATLALPSTDGQYDLYGYKWFTSATDSDMALTLARDTDANGQPLETSSSKGLSMFFLKVRDEAGQLNNMEIMRLKDKLGTRQLPTAELLLDGTKAYRVSLPGKGVASISTMLLITRLHNSIGAAAGMRRMVNLARDYSKKRTAFGKAIYQFPLHMNTLTWMEVEARAATLFALDTARLLGIEESTPSSASAPDTAPVLRLLSPVAKLYTARQAVAVASMGLECFGGAGFLEDTGLPSMLRDAQVLPIWEGTTSVLSLDVLRAIARSNGTCLSAFHSHVTSRLGDIAQLPPTLVDSGRKVTEAAEAILVYVAEHMDSLEDAAQDLAYAIARVHMGMLLIEQATSTRDGTDIFAANRWCEKDLLPMVTKHRHGNYDASTGQLERDLVFEGYQNMH